MECIEFSTYYSRHSENERNRLLGIKAFHCVSCSYVRTHVNTLQEQHALNDLFYLDFQTRAAQ